MSKEGDGYNDWLFSLADYAKVVEQEDTADAVGPYSQTGVEYLEAYAAEIEKLRRLRINNHPAQTPPRIVRPKN